MVTIATLSNRTNTVSIELRIHPAEAGRRDRAHCTASFLLHAGGEHLTLVQNCALCHTEIDQMLEGITDLSLRARAHESVAPFLLVSASRRFQVAIYPESACVDDPAELCAMAEWWFLLDEMHAAPAPEVGYQLGVRLGDLESFARLLYREALALA